MKTISRLRSLLIGLASISMGMALDAGAAEPADADSAAPGAFRLSLEPRGKSDTPSPVSASVQEERPLTLTQGVAMADSDPWNDRTDAWRYRSYPALWAAGNEGTTGGDRVTAEVDAGFDDLLEELEVAFSLDFEFGKGPWSVLFFGQYYNFKVDGDTPRGREVDVEADFAIVDLAFAYRILDTPVGDSGRLTFEPLAGVRWTYFELDLEVTGPRRESNFDFKEDWFDPYVGGRVRWDFNERWNWTTTGTVGGFGVGSDFAWTVNSFLEYRFTPKWSVLAGYRVIEYDYDDNGFIWDITMHGPVVGLSIRW